MGLRGSKASKELLERNRRIWRAYISLRVLGYNTNEQIYNIVAVAFNVTRDVVINVVKMTSPVGCYDDG